MILTYYYIKDEGAIYFMNAWGGGGLDSKQNSKDKS